MFRLPHLKIMDAVHEAASSNQTKLKYKKAQVQLRTFHDSVRAPLEMFMASLVHKDSENDRKQRRYHFYRVLN